MDNVGIKNTGITLTLDGNLVNVTGGSLAESFGYLDFTSLDSTRKQQIPDTATLEGSYTVDFFANASLIGSLYSTRDNCLDGTAVNCSVATVDTDESAATKSGAFTGFLDDLSINWGGGSGMTGSAKVTMDSDITWT